MVGVYVDGEGILAGYWSRMSDVYGGRNEDQRRTEDTENKEGFGTNQGGSGEP